VDQKDNPTPPAEGASGTRSDEQGDKQADRQDGGARPSVAELLAAARGDAAPPAKTPPPAASKTPVTPSAARASSGTVGESAPAGDAPGKSFPSATPPAARVAPASGASKTTSTPTASVNQGVAKAVATKPPAPGPLVQTAPDPPVNKFRRRIVWGVVASFTGVLGLSILRFFLPRAIFEPSSIFRIGFPGDYALGVDTKWQQQYRIWVVRNSERLFVIYARCTHLGCTPDWKASENKFKCPCHGSGYDSEGVNFEGPAPRPMDRAAVTVDAEGQIVVNTGKLYDWQKGGTNHFNDDSAFIRV
jgi:cytochrome b6-f complex iron-sulfur subunit